ncbi:MAG: L-threonylcarbamoyladenylate synthase [Actinomycetota bacterium]|nr:L-threonylcarbamoyladenylate synthase [Actinomycetota bacterium]
MSAGASVLTLDAGSDGSTRLDTVAQALAAGEVVVVPTDTVYGLAVATAVPGATRRLFEIKVRPEKVALPVLVADEDQASAVVDHVERAAPVTARFWPGPLTVVLPRHQSFRADLGGDGATVAVRVPDHDFVRDLCRRVGPLATTSANLHGSEPCLSAREAMERFREAVAVVVDGGACEGLPSTVASFSDSSWTVLREGSVRAEDLAATFARAGRTRSG